MRKQDTYLFLSLTMLSISICWGSCRTWHVSCGTSPDFIYMFEESRSYFAAVPSRNDHQYIIYVINNKLFQQQSTSPVFQVIFGSIMCSVLPVNRNAKIRKGHKPVPTALCCRDLFPVKDLLSLWMRSSLVFIHGFTFVKMSLVPFSVVSILHTVRIFWIFFSHSSYGRCWETVIGDYFFLRIFFVFHTSPFLTIQRFEGYINSCIDLFVTGNFSKGHNLFWNKNFLNVRMDQVLIKSIKFV